jgi:hypothetical protein
MWSEKVLQIYIEARTDLLLNTVLELDLGKEGTTLRVLGLVLDLLGSESTRLFQVLRVLEISILNGKENRLKILQNCSPIIRAKVIKKQETR